jgi:hypothetical protein
MGLNEDCRVFKEGPESPNTTDPQMLISRKVDCTVHNFDPVKLALSGVVVEAIEDVVTSKYIKGPRLSEARHQGG